MVSYTVKFLHVSDTHLGIKQYGLLDREKDVYEAFAEVVEIAKREKVDAVLHAGDMFDKSTPKPFTLIAAFKPLLSLAEKGIEFYVSPGNHEYPKAIDEGSPVRLLEIAGLAKGPDPGKPHGPTIHRVGVDKKVILAIFPPTGLSALRTFSIEKKREEFLIALAHARLCDALKDAEGIPLEKCSSQTPLLSTDITGNVDYAALGDVHVVWEGKLPSGGRAVYPGATEHFAVDEYERSGGRRFVYLIKLEDGTLAEVRRIELKSVRPWIVLRAPYAQIMKSVEELKRGQGKPPLLYIEVTDPIDKAKREKLLQKLRVLVTSGEALDYVFHSRQQEETKARLSEEVQQLELSQVFMNAFRQLLKKEGVREDCLSVNEIVDKLKDFVSSPSEDGAKALLKSLESALSYCR
ncbi:MAG: exonuclease SbcCD subunit D [Acidilobaceae archaeon]